MFTNHRLKSFSNYKVETTHIAPKLIRELDKLNNKLEPDEFKQIQYGTIETWLLWNITKEKVFATDVTCASSTGLYDMYRVSEKFYFIVSYKTKTTKHPSLFKFFE